MKESSVILMMSASPPAVEVAVGGETVVGRGVVVEEGTVVEIGVAVEADGKSLC